MDEHEVRGRGAAGGVSALMATAKKKTNKPAPRSAWAKDIDEYLGRLPADQRAALVKVRRTIKAAAPEAIGSISYGVPTFKLDGRPLLYFAALKEHLSLYATSKGTVRFTPDEPVSAAVVTKFVKERIALIQSRR